MARALVDAADAAARPGAPALERRTLVDVDGVHDEVVAVPVQRRIRLRVRDGGAQHLLDVVCGGALRELQDRPRLGNGAPPDVVGDEPGLPRRHAHELGSCLNRVAHQRFFTCVFWSPAWPRKWRGGANSPSLWPTICSETNTGTCLRPSWTAIV